MVADWQLWCDHYWRIISKPDGIITGFQIKSCRITSLMMGGWFLSTSIGNKLSGILASQWDQYDNKVNYFWLNFILLFARRCSLFVILRWLNRVMKEKGVN